MHVKIANAYRNDCAKSYHMQSRIEETFIELYVHSKPRVFNVRITFEKTTFAYVNTFSKGFSI